MKEVVFHEGGLSKGVPLYCVEQFHVNEVCVHVTLAYTIMKAHCLIVIW